MCKMKTRTIRIERKVERVADSVGEWRGKELIHNTYMIPYVSYIPGYIIHHTSYRKIIIISYSL